MLLYQVLGRKRKGINEKEGEGVAAQELQELPPQLVIPAASAGLGVFESGWAVPGYHVVVPVQIADGHQSKRRTVGGLCGLKCLLSLVGEGVEVDNRCVYCKTWENGYRFTLC